MTEQKVDYDKFVRNFPGLLDEDGSWMEVIQIHCLSKQRVKEAFKTFFPDAFKDGEKPDGYIIGKQPFESMLVMLGLED